MGSIKLPTIPSSTSDLDHSSSYTDFQVKKPKWCDSGIPGYQLQTTQVLQNMFDRFNLPEHIPLLSETCSKMIVLSAEHNFETSNPKKTQNKNTKYPFFSKEHKEAYRNHELICKKWRIAGRPAENSHPAKAAKLTSQRNLQSIARGSESSASLKQHNELMDTYYSNMSLVVASSRKSVVKIQNAQKFLLLKHSVELFKV